jgi:hypothetical protein
VLVEDGSGLRQVRSEAKLKGEAAHRVVDVWPADLPEGSRVVLVLQNAAGVLPAVVEHVIDPRHAPKTAQTEKAAGVPRPRTQPPTTRSGNSVPVRAVGETPGTPATPPADPPKDAAEASKDAAAVPEEDEPEAEADADETGDAER